MRGLLPNPHIRTNPCGFGPPEPSSGNSFLLLRLAAVRPQVTFRLLCMAGPATVRPCVLFESIRLRPFASGVLIRSMATGIDDPVLQTTTHVRPKSSTRAEVYRARARVSRAVPVAIYAGVSSRRFAYFVTANLVAHRRQCRAGLMTSSLILDVLAGKLGDESLAAAPSGVRRVDSPLGFGVHCDCARESARLKRPWSTRRGRLKPQTRLIIGRAARARATGDAPVGVSARTALGTRRPAT